MAKINYNLIVIFIINILLDKKIFKSNLKLNIIKYKKTYF